MKIKAVLDTNVLISAVFWKGPPFEILKAWQEKRFRLAISLPILQEYRRVLDELANHSPRSQRRQQLQFPAVPSGPAVTWQQ